MKAFINAGLESVAWSASTLAPKGSGTRFDKSPCIDGIPNSTLSVVRIGIGVDRRLSGNGCRTGLVFRSTPFTLSEKFPDTAFERIPRTGLAPFLPVSPACAILHIDNAFHSLTSAFLLRQRTSVLPSIPPFAPCRFTSCCFYSLLNESLPCSSRRRVFPSRKRTRQ